MGGSGKEGTGEEVRAGEEMRGGEEVCRGGWRWRRAAREVGGMM